MRRLLRIGYPKLLVLAVFVLVAYLLFRDDRVVAVMHLPGVGYVGTFVAGLLFSFGFTTPFSVGYFVTLHPASPLLAALVGAAGAVIADVAIFKLIKFSFMDEFERLSRTAAFKKARRLFNQGVPRLVRTHLVYASAGLLLASPVPDEVAIALVAGLGKVRLPLLVAVSFFSKVVGIFILVSLQV